MVRNFDDNILNKLFFFLNFLFITEKTGSYFLNCCNCTGCAATLNNPRDPYHDTIL